MPLPAHRGSGGFSGWWRPDAGLHAVEQLADEAECIDLVVVLAGGKRQQLSTQIRDPRCALRHVEAFQRHAASDGLRSHRLVVPGRKRLEERPGMAFHHPALQERPDAGVDLARPRLPIRSAAIASPDRRTLRSRHRRWPAAATDRAGTCCRRDRGRRRRGRCSRRRPMSRRSRCRRRRASARVAVRCRRALQPLGLEVIAGLGRRALLEQGRPVARRLVLLLAAQAGGVSVGASPTATRRAVVRADRLPRLPPAAR